MIPPSSGQTGARRLRATVVLTIAALLLSLLPTLPAHADPPLLDGHGWTNYPDPDGSARAHGGEIPAPNTFTSLADIAANFNHARGVENGDLCTGSCEANAVQMPLDFAFPSGYASLSMSEKMLVILNLERTARGLLPFTGTNAAVDQMAEEWAQDIATTGVFEHRTNTSADLVSICEPACRGYVGNVTENLFGTTSTDNTYIAERAVYLWLYRDRTLGGSGPDQEWGHRHGLLVNNFTDNHGSNGTEGFMGTGLATGGGWTYLVWNAADTSQWPVNTVGGFSDVPETAFFADAVVWAANAGITNGTSPTRFSPNSQLNRAQMATFLWRYANEPPPPASHPFSDVIADSYYEDAVAWLAQTGVTTGTSATTFSPLLRVTRAQMAVFLWRYANEPAPPASHPFTDVPPGAFYEDAVAWLAQTGITTGTSATTFSPNSRVTRGQMVTFLHRYEQIFG